MANDQKPSIIKKRLIKIIVPGLIVISIGGIWLAKNPKELPIKGSTVASEGGSVEKTNAEYPMIQEPDFELHVTEAIDLEQLKSYGVPIMLDFGAQDCAPCKQMAPVLVKLNEELQGKAIIKFIDVWKYQELAAGYPLRVIPTQMFFDKEGKPYTPADPQASRMTMYSSKETDEHVLTTHEGGMTEEMILIVLKEMGLEE